MSEAMYRSATFSDDRRYRYSLIRCWEPSAGIVAFIGLNPSTADENDDDPTIRRCIGFARNWGYGGLLMLNAFAFRATDPHDVWIAEDPIGTHNNDCLRFWTRFAQQVVACWGSHGTNQGRSDAVRKILAGVPLYCFGTTKAGQPKHPLYLRADRELVAWE